MRSNAHSGRQQDSLRNRVPQRIALRCRTKISEIPVNEIPVVRPLVVSRRKDFALVKQLAVVLTY